MEKPDIIANTLNDFFVSVGAPKTNNSPKGRQIVSPSSKSMLLSPVNEREKKNIFKYFKSKSSFGTNFPRLK